MSLKDFFKQVRDNYVINQAHTVELPEFVAGTVRRYRVNFSGRVQKVGFRLEVCELARRLGLTGWCKNLEDGSVLAEFQGPTERIDFLISFMESLKRIKIREKVMEELEVLPEEREFVKG